MPSLLELIKLKNLQGNSAGLNYKDFVDEDEDENENQIQQNNQLNLPNNLTPTSYTENRNFSLLPPINENVYAQYIKDMQEPEKPKGFFGGLKAAITQHPSLITNLAAGITSLTGGNGYIASALGSTGQRMAQEENEGLLNQLKNRQQMRENYVKTYGNLQNKLMAKNLGQNVGFLNADTGETYIQDIDDNGDIILKPVMAKDYPNYKWNRLNKEDFDNLDKYTKKQQILTKEFLNRQKGKAEIDIQSLPKKEAIKNKFEIEASKGKKLSEKEIGLNELKSTLDSMEKLLENNPVGVGFGGKLEGLAQSGLGTIGENESAAAYNSTRSGIVFFIAKMLGNTGTPSDKDMERAEGLVAKLTDPKNVRDEKNKYLKFLISEWKKNNNTNSNVSSKPTNKMQQTSNNMKNKNNIINFNSIEEADKSGLANGTIVMIKGRRYQIG